MAVLSTGVDPGVIPGVTTGPDYTGSGRSPGNQFWGASGTANAGLIASVAPEARFLSLRVTLEYNDPLNSNAAITRRLPAAIASGINYAVSHGASVIDLPLDPGANGLNDAGQLTGDPAASGGSAAEAAAVRNAISHGVVLVAPAGDNGAGSDSVNYPAAYSGVLAVGATTRSGTVASYSSKRPDVALLAPGNALTVDSPEGPITLSTSDNAAALVTGIATLIRSRYPGLSVAQVDTALTRGAIKSHAAATAGVANAVGALRSAALLAATKPSPGASPPASIAARPDHKPVTLTGVASGALADSVIRDAVIALGAVILVLAGLLLAARAHRRRQNPESSTVGLRETLSGLRTAPHGSHARHGRAPSSATLTPRALSRRPSTARGRGRPMLAPVPDALRRSEPRRESRPPWEPAPPPIGERSGPIGEPGSGSGSGEDPAAPPLPPARTPMPPTARPFSPPARPLPPTPRALPSAESFAAAPIPTDSPEWFQWNPNASTDEFPAFPPDSENGH